MVEGTRIESIRKRDGRIVGFDRQRISNAIYRAMEAAQEDGVDLENESQRIAQNVERDLEAKAKEYKESAEDGKYTPDIEEIQNHTERNLTLTDHFEAAKRFILYRHNRAQIRQHEKKVPERVKNLVNESRKYFNNELGEFVHYRTYSRWKEDEGRRETWIETVDRYVDFMGGNLESRVSEDESNEIKNSILTHKVMPSMRLLWSAGKAAGASNVAAYNCAYTTPNQLEDFGEIMYVLMCGAGVGFSVENQTVQQLPIIKRQNGERKSPYVVGDSKEGWAKALNEGLKTWYEGYDMDFDYSKVRPAGARLKTMGGRSSGPEALKILINYSRERILGNQGRRLNSLDVHDIICKIGEIVVVGGVRRSALISLSDLDDILMRGAKTGEFFRTEPQRELANNSAAYNYKPTATEFLGEWLSLAESGTGERGIFNRYGLESQLPERRWKTFKEYFGESGTNPCGEIYLRAREFCNLTEIVARFNDTLYSLLEKVKVATIMGTYQSTLTDFPFLSKKWKENCEEERLLGVSITGIMDCPILRNPEVLEKLREHAVEVNRTYSKKFGINPSTCVTCVKPSGTVSQLVNASPGLHARHSPYYNRHIRISANDPLFHMIKDQKYPYYPEVGQGIDSATTYVLPFPVKAPENSTFIGDLSAIDQLEHWKKFKEHYTEHNPSVTINIGTDEWVESADWLYNNWEIAGGLAFLPRSDHVYKLAPFEEITEAKYNEMRSKFPKIDFSHILFYEEDDSTMGAKEYACVGQSCDI